MVCVKSFLPEMEQFYPSAEFSNRLHLRRFYWGQKMAFSEGPAGGLLEACFPLCKAETPGDLSLLSIENSAVVKLVSQPKVFSILLNNFCKLMGPFHQLHLILNSQTPPESLSI